MIYLLGKIILLSAVKASLEEFFGARDSVPLRLLSNLTGRTILKTGRSQI